MDPTRQLVAHLALESGPIVGSLSPGSTTATIAAGPGLSSAIAAQQLPFTAAEAAAAPARGRTSFRCRPGTASK